MADAANYMYEKASVKGVGYKNAEMIVSTKEGFNGSKLVEKESGSGNVITEKTELEAEKQIGSGCVGDDFGPVLGHFNGGWFTVDYSKWPTGFGPMDYINFTKEAEFEYMPVSYQTSTYDQKWMDKLCVQNYKIGAVMTEMYVHAEHLQKQTEVKTRLYEDVNFLFDIKNIQGTTVFKLQYPPYPCCTGVLEANLNSNVIGVAHIGWISRDPNTNSKGRHNEWGRSVEDLTGVFSIEKFIQLWATAPAVPSALIGCLVCKFCSHLLFSSFLKPTYMMPPWSMLRSSRSGV